MDDEAVLGPALAALSTDQRRAFFAQLVRAMSIVLRGIQLDGKDEGTTPQGRIAGAAEVLHAVGNQMCADAGLGSAPDDEEFVKSLMVKGDYWGVGDDVRWALEHASRRSG